MGEPPHAQHAWCDAHIATKRAERQANYADENPHYICPSCLKVAKRDTSHAQMVGQEVTFCGRYLPGMRKGAAGRNPLLRHPTLPSLPRGTRAPTRSAATGVMKMAFRLTPQGRLHYSENDIESQCLDLLHQRHWWTLKVHCGRFQHPDGRWITGALKGTPDYVAGHAVHPMFLLEIKRPGARLSPDQVSRQFEISFAYHLAIVTVSSAEELVAWLGEHAQ
jgi:hypothetical protein